MRILLDTHALMWAALEPSRIGPAATAAINDPDNDVYFSTASTWEMAIKIKIGKMLIPGGLSLFITDVMTQLLLAPLYVLPEHTISLEAMPLHHSDPLDRMLVAQSQYENMSIVSIDGKLDPYGVRRIW